MRSKNIIRFAALTALILMIPLVAMQFTSEVHWTLSDFIIAGVLLFGSGLAYEFLSSRAGTTAYRLGAGLSVLTALLLVWMNGAVGLIGSENNDANLLYIAVIAVLFFGSLIARFRPHEMSYVLFITALAQALVPVIAFLIWSPEITSWGAAGVLGVFALNTFFVLLFIFSALLFRRASAARSSTL